MGSDLHFRQQLQDVGSITKEPGISGTDLTPSTSGRSCCAAICHIDVDSDFISFFFFLQCTVGLEGGMRISVCRKRCSRPDYLHALVTCVLMFLYSKNENICVCRLSLTCTRNPPLQVIQQIDGRWVQMLPKVQIQNEIFECSGYHGNIPVEEVRCLAFWTLLLQFLLLVFSVSFSFPSSSLLSLLSLFLLLELRLWFFSSSLLLFPWAHPASFVLISFTSLLLSLLLILFFFNQNSTQPNLKVNIHQHSQAPTSSRYCFITVDRNTEGVHTVIILLLRGEHLKWSTADLQFAMHPGKFDDLTENKESKPS